MGDDEIPNWLQELPLAPTFRPTLTEFADPIAYISNLEKEASEFGICKIIPPLPKPSKRYVFSNLNKSLSKCPDFGSGVNLLNDCSLKKTGSESVGIDGEGRAVFTTRQQELGQCVKKVKGAAVQHPPSVVHKQVWQSGEAYTLEQFESKARGFAKSILGSVKDVSPLVIEELFWKAASEKPMYIEYANDVPGSAFEEPLGQFRYSHRRRRKRNSYQRSRQDSDTKKSEMIDSGERTSHNNEVKSAFSENVSDTCLEVSKSPTAPEILSADKTPHSSGRRNPNSCSDMEGTAGWKLSNSPWNLQVIARSPGSLTRFMPDDIPGVTSPMVYIGMLFSWFAWHVEDHELHSMNFLHTGSSKTWYAVPGGYALDFEELIHSAAFGGNVDRLAALSLLGNKTTLISPEIVVASKIPCCRLIQNPGEFVVTFPKAYHVGFSHGFNCGEAANFGTPHWLKVAKEAAVRRAAMNYLPMLSHQQLLYLLTMSFVSRVPRSLLPGVRSSRRKDRQKEDRELSVKKAFIQDILKENDVLSVLIGKESSYHAVLWNADLLPYTSKGQLTTSAGTPVDMKPGENATHIECGNSNNDQNFLFDEMSLYMEQTNDLYLGSDDLSCDFQVDSGTLACVACGILGFPFMSVVQPSQKASMKLQPECLAAQEFIGVSGHEKSHSSRARHGSVTGCAAEYLSPVPNALPPEKDLLTPSTTEVNNDWNTVNKFLRPRSFCLEHAVEVLELLRCKGGANLLVICHSDYQKIKAPAAAIAEEIGCPFNYTEVPLDVASKDDLNLIDLAVDDEHDECREDWTSKLGINLRYCVKVRKNSSSKQVQHALALGGLFPKQSPSSDFQTVKWQSRKSRSKKLNHSQHSRPCESFEKKDVVSEGRSDGTSFKREEKIIQYSRRNNKLKAAGSEGAGMVCGQPATRAEGNKYSRMTSESDIYVSQNATSRCARFDTSEITIAEEANEKTSANLLVIALDERFKMQTDEHKIGKSNSAGGNCNLDSEGQSQILVHENVLMDKDSFVAETTNLCAADSFLINSDAGMVNKVMEKSCVSNEVCDFMTLDDEKQEENQTTDRSNNKASGSCSSDVFTNTMVSIFAAVEEIKTLKGRNEEPSLSPTGQISESSPASTEKASVVPTELCAGADFFPCRISRSEDFWTADSTVGEHVSTSVTQSCISIEVSSKVPMGSLSEEGTENGVTSETVQPETGATEAEILGPVMETQNQPMPGSVDEFEVPGVACAIDKVSGSVPMDDKEEWKNQTTYGYEDLISSQDTSRCHPSPALIQTYSRIKRKCRATQDLCKGPDVSLSQHEKELENVEPSIADPEPSHEMGRKRKREVEQVVDDNFNLSGFIRGPCERLRPRAVNDQANRSGIEKINKQAEEKPVSKKVKKLSDNPGPPKNKKEEARKSHRCGRESCRMSFETKAELMMHKRNRCTHEGCGKRFSSHKYAVIHSRVHDDDRPFKCPWKGCSRSFKWGWARTEHIRLHTGERPYHCKVEGCGLTFRFVSDFSRHRRNTGHHAVS